MQDGSIEISSTGFKFSYLRFLADGAAGLFLVLLLTVAYYADVPILGQDRSFREVFSGQLSGEVKIFLMILLGLLAVPLGLALNAAGWFLLGWVQGWGCAFWFDSKWFLTEGTKEIFQQDLLAEAMQLGSNDIYRRAKLYEEFLMAAAPSHLVHVQHIMGLQRFLRSLSVVFCSAGVYLVLSKAEPRWVPAIYAVTTVFSLTLLSLLEYYICLAIVCRTYLASFEQAESALYVENVRDKRASDIDAELLDRLMRRLSSTSKAAS